MYQWVDLGGITAQLWHHITHSCKVYNRWDSSVVLDHKLDHKQKALIDHKIFRVGCQIKTIRMHLAGLKGISACFGDVLSQSMIFSTSLSVT